jgi:hypothetical protein
VLHWKSGHKIGCKRKGRVDFALFNIPRIAKSLMPVDNERKHGGVAEPIRRYGRDVNIEEEERIHQLKALRFLNGRNVLVDYYLYRESIELSFHPDGLLDVV